MSPKTPLSPEAAQLRPMICAAIQGASSYPAHLRADVYRGIATVTETVDPELHQDANRLASAIDDAAGLQLYFQGLAEDPAPATHA